MMEFAEDLTTDWGVLQYMKPITMKAIHPNLRLSILVLTLSMSAMPNIVNGQTESLTTVNKAKSSNLAALIERVLKTGTDGNFGENLAPIVGLPKAMPSKEKEILIKQHDLDTEKRACYVVYENVDSVAPAIPDEKHPVCAYIVKIKRSGLDKEIRYFRVNLDGKLEKVVLVQAKYAESGKVVRGSGVKFDQDINSPEVKKTFETEMKFWLKDWLKKEQKAAAKKSASADKPLH